MKKIKGLTKEHEHELTNREIDYIQNFTNKTSNFYGLPKYINHWSSKAPIKEQTSEKVRLQPPSDVTIRPIVAQSSSPTHRLRNFLDLILKRLCQHVPSYIRDDFDFLNHILEEVDENTILVSFDVISLGTSIPHDLGLQATDYWLNNFSTTLERLLSKDFILKAISIVLKENKLKFDNKN